MGSFLRENWIWIVAPLIVILIAVMALVFSGTDSFGDGEFQYDLM
jgi:ABC-type dipeptide/oligopeptide/nickel transport system permease subunit